MVNYNPGCWATCNLDGARRIENIFLFKGFISLAGTVAQASIIIVTQKTVF